MIGSETFIIVAFICNEKSTPDSLASATSAARNASSADFDMNVPSMISPSSSGTSLKTSVPFAPTNSIRAVVA